MRSIAGSNKIIPLIKSQSDFDKLFQYLFSTDRLITMRAADAIEKITLTKPEFLRGHNHEIIHLTRTAVNKELKWHLALIVSRLELNMDELGIVWGQLTKWALDKRESRIVRVNSIQSLYDLTNKYEELKRDFELTISEIKHNNIPSINARLRKLKLK